MAKRIVKLSKRDFITCPRCDKDNVDEPDFIGCARGSCDVEVKGRIETTTTVICKKAK